MFCLFRYSLRREDPLNGRSGPDTIVWSLYFKSVLKGNQPLSRKKGTALRFDASTNLPNFFNVDLLRFLSVNLRVHRSCNPVAIKSKTYDHHCFFNVTSDINYPQIK